jgi:putative PIN family toxin of toxin-antitoxin system
MVRVVVDTNIWIRILLRGRVTLPVLAAWQNDQFRLITSIALVDEYDAVWQRPRLSKRIDPSQAKRLRLQMEGRGELVELRTVPPRCRDPKDHPVLSTAIDGHADLIVSGDDDLRADDELRVAMAEYGVQLLGVNGLLHVIRPK